VSFNEKGNGSVAAITLFSFFSLGLAQRRRWGQRFCCPLPFYFIFVGAQKPTTPKRKEGKKKKKTKGDDNFCFFFFFKFL
jgi:hypothetical protein